jgi:AcrR family transcriptional regulator
MKPGSKTSVISLRERKKVKTRAAIQRHAMRLFRKQGYDETTVEQIAASAEVSPSTFFRYFPTKEDLVLYDTLDPLIIDSFSKQPPELGPIQAIRATIRSVFGDLSEEEIAELEERERLMRTIPELRSRVLEDLMRSMQVFTRMLAKRLKRSANDMGVRTLVGAITGIIMSVWFTNTQDDSGKLFKALDQALAQLETGLRL